MGDINVFERANGAVEQVRQSVSQWFSQNYVHPKSMKFLRQFEEERLRAFNELINDVKYWKNDAQDDVDKFNHQWVYRNVESHMFLHNPHSIEVLCDVKIEADTIIKKLQRGRGPLLNEMQECESLLKNIIQRWEAKKLE